MTSVAATDQVKRPGRRYVGRATPRLEDRALLTGAGSFADDRFHEGALSARVLRSPVARGRIIGIDASAALEVEGVECVITASDAPRARIPQRVAPSAEAERALQPVLAEGEVRYVGEPVAVVVAADPYLAEDAEQRIAMYIEELPPLIDVDAAVRAAAVPIHPTVSDNVLQRFEVAHGGAIDAALSRSAAVVSDRLRVQRHTAIPLEGRGLVAAPDGLGGVRVWGAAKVLQFNRRALSEMLCLPQDSIELIETDVGGGFGPRGELYPEDFLIPWLAMHLGEPVKWIEDRREHFLAANHSRQAGCEIEVGADSEGRLLGLRALVEVDLGAYCRTNGTVPPLNLATHLIGPYEWEAVRVDSRAVLTNKTPAGTYRGPGQYEAAFFRERMLDRLAQKLDIPPDELRSRNLIPAERIPCEVDLGGKVEPISFPSGDFPLTFQRLREVGGRYSSRRRADALGRRSGFGLATFIEAGARGPYEWARVTAAPDGSFRVRVGVASVGQGVHTALAQIAADALEVPIADVWVEHGDTSRTPEGAGAFSSRATLFGGNAVLGAVADLRRRARARAAAALGATAADVSVRGRTLRLDRDGRAIDMAELGCEGAFRYERAGRGFSMGAAAAAVRIDTGTGEVRVDRCFVAADVGLAINPMLVDGQLVGAAAQGMAGALLEELAYDERGQLASASFIDYLMPTAAEVPPIDAIVLELSPQGADPAAITLKGAGEAGIVGVGAAIANAVADAIGEAGQEITELPVRPARVLELLAAGADRPVP